MGTSRRDKTARRAALYEASVRRKQAEDDHRAALHEAMRWLLQEAAKVRRNRPRGVADSLDAALAEQVMKLAASVPSYGLKETHRVSS